MLTNICFPSQPPESTEMSLREVPPVRHVSDLALDRRWL